MRSRARTTSFAEHCGSSSRRATTRKRRRHVLEAELMTGKVLLVEDNELSLRVGIRMLEVLGFAVDVATDGADAVQAAQLQSYRAILMDCQMPVLDGYAAASAIRRNEGDARRVPIIAVTAPSLIDDTAARA